MLASGCIVPLHFDGPERGGSSSGGPLGSDGAPGGAVTTGEGFTSGGGEGSDSSSGADAREPEQPANDGDCCETADGTGCGDPVVAACVCAADPRCCSHAWDALCVEHVDELGCGGCLAGPNDTRVADACCSAHAAPGCADEAVAACVCGHDPYCCDIAWDQVCVDAIDAYGCGECPGPVMPTDCCMVGELPGCPDPEIEACVCANDSYCCEQQWDELCVDEVATYQCGDCIAVDPTGDATTGGPIEPGDCCAIGAGPSCDDPAVVDCVCGQDLFCCENAWDGVCVDEVDALGCGMCANAGTSGGGTDGATGGASTGAVTY